MDPLVDQVSAKGVSKASPHSRKRRYYYLVKCSTFLLFIVNCESLSRNMLSILVLDFDQTRLTDIKICQTRTLFRVFYLSMWQFSIFHCISIIYWWKPSQWEEIILYTILKSFKSCITCSKLNVLNAWFQYHTCDSSITCSKSYIIIYILDSSTQEPYACTFWNWVPYVCIFPSLFKLVSDGCLWGHFGFITFCDMINWFHYISNMFPLSFLELEEIIWLMFLMDVSIGRCFPFKVSLCISL